MPQTLRGSFEQALRPLPSVVKGVQACRLPGLKCLKRCAAASSRHSGHCPLLLSAFKPATWLNARLWPQILRSFVLHDSIDWFRCENLSRKPYKHIISIYILYIYIYVYPHPWKGVGGTRALAHSINTYCHFISTLISWHVICARVKTWCIVDHIYSNHY